MAQNMTLPATSGPLTGELKKDGEISGFISSPPGADMLRNAATNRDGTRTIKKGQQVPEANELNKKFCERIGAKDITNESDLTIGSGTQYAVVCLGKPGTRPSSMTTQAAPEQENGRVFLPEVQMVPEK